ncbi:RsmB/NOP family class I SAM-dependent RNA methyltransferase [Rhodospirillum rubrum]|uniref:tRNA and rRNA cytosine-C5-methylase n=1 Tax=Rhodospirillum rubrum (strain ATCC 11170 / ATH 1.1.1 / DSM 467 / LMG 4362 / NCIMB 8255 / S1) TaxID=269796 RepID=Q2RN41_RHORT|nr:transcription antitermination factor NusB [Rhodospirillum rubrum]ABC24454.1 tRNA and rRNA cytosine-C5-methylase [Rhodospirillum rubrum ATCC 11170]AEO50205.1 tRNA and rRNA cytosine-C5-methylase [Rhodospirillum rubrum F11]MBK5956174.1 SAM-dependent methyltransferase [Rhodospirillum rubrum]QXG80373.1 methyltransferase domain-containing protein [Rhodospirillum rubrum]HAQ01392.1 SAM-dependent methyltransferase [Rhodospirillum rubrum]
MKDTATATRAAALDLLSAVLDHGRPLDDVFDAATRKLEPRDRAFARLLAATTLRRMGRLEKVIKTFLDRPLPRRAVGAKHILRLGAAQMLFLDTPPHAAVATSVDVARVRRLAPYAGLINAVLRKVADHGAARLAGFDDPLADLPRWLGQSWIAAYGAETAARLAEACGREAPLDLTPRDGDGGALAELVGGLALPGGSVRLPTATAVRELAGFTEGQWWVQDAAAALPVLLAGVPLKGARVVDFCAAPGGKTLQLAAAGAQVWAVDRSATRLARLRENLERTGLGDAVNVVEGDALTFTLTDGQQADVVLVDAPCTATGTFRRHPDAPWLKRPGDAAALAALQDSLLDAAVRLVRPGGVIVYCVCSLQPEEAAPRIEALLARSPEISRKPITAGEGGVSDEMITAEGDVRLFPFHLDAVGGLDGFFIARLVRGDAPR